MRQTVPLGVLVALVLALPAFGVALVKPTVVGTTAHSSREDVRSFGYSIYYTLVNIGGAAGPYVASYVHQRMSVENVFRVAALSVFVMFIGVLIFFKEPNRDRDTQTPSMAQAGRNFLTVLSNPRFMLFLAIFTGYWIVYWQEFLTLPLYVHNYISPTIDTELLLMTGPVVVIALTVVITLLMQKVAPLMAITTGTLISALGWIFLIVVPSRTGGSADAGRRRAGRNRDVSAVLRLCVAAGSGRTAGNLHGLRFPAAGDRLAHWGRVWRVPDSPLRRSEARTGRHVVGHRRNRSSHGRVAVGV